jgi:hypothetical protein
MVARSRFLQLEFSQGPLFRVKRPSHAIISAPAIIVLRRGRLQGLSVRGSCFCICIL